MNRRHWLTVLGLIVSFSLIGVVFPRLDWPTFSLTLRSVNVFGVATTAVGIAAGVLVRSLRWNLISGVPSSQYWNFWRAVNLGYLGNMVCPARAGELLRMMAIQRFAHRPGGQAVISAVIDRVADGLVLGVFLVIAIVYGGLAFPWSKAIIGVVGLFGFAGLNLAAFIW